MRTPGSVQALDAFPSLVADLSRDARQLVQQAVTLGAVSVM